MLAGPFFGLLTMSESEELIVVDGPSASAFQPHREATFKKRELFEKSMAARKSYATDLSLPGTSTQLTSTTPSSSSAASTSAAAAAPTSVATSVLRTARHPAPKRDSNPVTSFPSAVSGAAPQLAMSSYPFRPQAECKPHPIIFGENIFIECSLLKSNVLLLREALLNPNLQAIDLQAITDDIRKAKEVLVEKVCLPLTDIQRTLQEQMSREHAAAMQSAHTNSVYSLGHDLASANLPLAPSALHPYPSHLYLYPVQEPLSERRPAVPDASCAPFSAQPAH